ncbi:MAG TPA: EthD family reductase, partial [Phenylobacterium sp.]|nr:EthD family reductase [Phenylobacterium sp.]
MKKLIALYKAPADAEAFMRHYRETHLPLVQRVPGLVKTELTLIERTLMGEPGNYLLAEMYYADEDSFRAAMKSPENAATGADRAKLAERIKTLVGVTVTVEVKPAGGLPR